MQNCHVCECAAVVLRGCERSPYPYPCKNALRIKPGTAAGADRRKYFIPSIGRGHALIIEQFLQQAFSVHIDQE